MRILRVAGIVALGIVAAVSQIVKAQVPSGPTIDSRRSIRTRQSRGGRRIGPSRGAEELDPPPHGVGRSGPARLLAPGDLTPLQRPPHLADKPF